MTLVHGVPVRGDDWSVAAVERTGGTPTDGHPDVVLHLRSPGTAVEQIIVASLVHHPGRLGHETLLQQVLQAALQEFHWRPLEIYPAGVKLPDVDYRGGEGQGDVFLPQEIVSPSLGFFEVMRINGASQTLSGLGSDRRPFRTLQRHRASSRHFR